MMTEEIGIWLHFLDLPAELSLAEKLDRQVDEVMSHWKKVETETMQDLHMTQMAMQMSMSLLRNVLGAVGLSLGPVENAIMGTIQITVESLIRIAAAWGTTGAGLLFTVAIGAAAIGLSAWSTAAVMAGMDAARGQIDHALAATQDLMRMFNMMGRR